jgi:hypothetical protein
MVAASSAIAQSPVREFETFLRDALAAATVGMMSSLADLDGSNVVNIDLGSAEFKANAHRHMAEWARRPPFYVLGHGQPQVVAGR